MMTETSEIERKSEEESRFKFTRKMALSIIRAAIILGVLIVTAYFIWFRLVMGYVPGGPETWGQFGDFVGGLLNPVFSFLALLVLVLSLLATNHALAQNERMLDLTRRELQQTREQIVNTKAALDEQTQLVRNNARAERLEDYAQKVYEEYVVLRDANLKVNLMSKARSSPSEIKPIKPGDALDIHGNVISKIIRKSEVNDVNWIHHYNDTVFGRLVDRLAELAKITLKAQTDCGVFELTEYYQQRVSRLMAGAIFLGYVTDAEGIHLVTSMHRLRMDRYRKVEDERLN